MKQQKLIKELPSLWRPEFIPFYPKEKEKYKLNDKEAILYGFIRHFLRNCSGKFFFTNEQLRYVLVGVKRNGTITDIVKNLVRKCPDIRTRLEIRKNGGTVRMIEWVGSQTDLRKSVIPNYGKPSAIKNKVNSITIDIYKDFDKKITITGVNQTILEAEKTRFLSWWSEKSDGSETERWQLEKVWDIKKRWQLWLEKAEEKRVRNLPRTKK